MVSIYVGIITFLLLLIPTKTHADITIKNDSTNSTHKVEFSINEYDGEGSSIWYEIKKGNVEHWKRGDSRGYLLAVRDENKLEMYYAFINGNYIYRDGDLYFDHPSYDNYKMPSLKTENHFTTGKTYELTIKNLTNDSLINSMFLQIHLALINKLEMPKIEPYIFLSLINLLMKHRLFVFGVKRKPYVSKPNFL